MFYWNPRIQPCHRFLFIVIAGFQKIWKLLAHTISITICVHQHKDFHSALVSSIFLPINRGILVGGLDLHFQKLYVTNNYGNGNIPFHRTAIVRWSFFVTWGRSNFSLDQYINFFVVSSEFWCPKPLIIEILAWAGLPGCLSFRKYKAL